MTPHIIKIINIRNIIIELSEGTDFSNLPIYGISIFAMYGDKYDNLNHPYTTYSQMVRGRETADWKIERITEIIMKDMGIS